MNSVPFLIVYCVVFLAALDLAIRGNRSLFLTAVLRLTGVKNVSTYVAKNSRAKVVGVIMHIGGVVVLAIMIFLGTGLLTGLLK